MAAAETPGGRAHYYQADARRPQHVYVWQTPIGVLVQPCAWNGKYEGEPFHWTDGKMRIEVEESGNNRGLMIYGPDGGRLEVRDDDAVRALWPTALPPDRRVYNMAAVTLVALVVAAAILTAIGLPAFFMTLSHLVPRPLEVQIGRALRSDIAASYCESPAQAVVLSRLTVALGRAPLFERAGMAFHTHIVPPGTDGITLVPGGDVVIDSHLFKLLRQPNELAALMAHEMAHEALHHPIAKLARRLPRSLAGAAGDGAHINSLLFRAFKKAVFSPYDEAQEIAADKAAGAALAELGYGRAGLVAALSHSVSGALLGTSHCCGDARQLALRGVNLDPLPPKAALTGEEWNVLRAGCLVASP